MSPKNLTLDHLMRIEWFMSKPSLNTLVVGEPLYDLETLS